METQNATRFTPHLNRDQKRLMIKIEFLLRDFPETLQPLTQTVEQVRNQLEIKQRQYKLHASLHDIELMFKNGSPSQKRNLRLLSKFINNEVRKIRGVLSSSQRREKGEDHESKK